MVIKVAKGTKDILPLELQKWSCIEEIIRNLCHFYGYKEIRTPVFEYTELFTRSIGKESEIVKKQMYTFNDKGKRSITLRPEGTAPIIRAYIEHKMYSWTLPVKLFYIAPMYRYERPQAGRFREFYQIGLEAIGIKNPLIDAELILLLILFFKKLELKKIELKINSLGCPICRKQFIKDLMVKFQSLINLFCENCQRRYEFNPLRIFDCKEEKCRINFKNLPYINEYLCKTCLQYFKEVTYYLKSLEIQYNVDPYLVRGLDYYTGTIFEVISTELGAQNSIAGGGRYDYLVEELGGPSTPAIGFSIGIERLNQIFKFSNNEKFNSLDIFFASIGKKAHLEAFKLSYLLRNKGFKVENYFGEKSLKTQLKLSNRLKAKFTIIIKEEELKEKSVILKNMNTSEQIKVTLENLEVILANKLKNL